MNKVASYFKTLSVSPTGVSNLRPLVQEISALPTEPTSQQLIKNILFWWQIFIAETRNTTICATTKQTLLRTDQKF